jgi:hypothetical protein
MTVKQPPDAADTINFLKFIYPSLFNIKFYVFAGCFPEFNYNRVAHI